MLPALPSGGTGNQKEPAGNDSLRRIPIFGTAGEAQEAPVGIVGVSQANVESKLPGTLGPT